MLAKDIYNQGSTSSSQQLPDCFEKLKEALVAIGREKGCSNVDLFVDSCMQPVQEQLDNCESLGDKPTRVLNKPINPAPALQREARLWLAGIRRRIGGKRSIRNPLFAEIKRDVPLEVFTVIVRMLRGLDGYVEPFYFHCENSKAIVLSFTSMRLAHELFGLLSGLSKDVLASYFKRSFSGVRKGLTAAVIVNKMKDFALIFKKRSGKLVIGFNYGEWNVSGFPQHVC